MLCVIGEYMKKVQRCSIRDIGESNPVQNKTRCMATPVAYEWVGSASELLKNLGRCRNAKDGQTDGWMDGHSGM